MVGAPGQGQIGNGTVKLGGDPTQCGDQSGGGLVGDQGTELAIDFLGAQRIVHRTPLAVTGSRARDLLSRCADADLSNEAFRWLSAQFITGTYGHCVRQGLGFAYLSPEHGSPGTELEVRVVGDLCRARVLGQPIYDPTSARLRL